MQNLCKHRISKRKLRTYFNILTKLRKSKV